MYRELINGLKIPTIGFGTWKIKLDETDGVIEAALNEGYRYFDMAQSYQNDDAIMKALKGSGISREDIFISNKLWTADRGYDNALRACERILEHLGVEYLDVYLVHWPAASHMYANWEEINASTWRAMERLYEEGYVRAIGVCNCKVHHLESFLKKANIPVMINQIEFHPGQINAEILAYCRHNQILIEAWGALAHGKMMKREPLKVMAEKYEKNIAQLCIRYCLQKGIVPIIKSTDKQHMRQNLEVFDFEINEQDMMHLDSMPYMGGSGLDPDRITLFG